MPRSQKNRQKLIDRLSTLLLVLYAAICVSPVVWFGISSLKPPGSVVEYPPRIFFVPTLENYAKIISEGILKYIWNSTLTGLLTVLLTLAVSCPAAYILSRIQFKGSQNIAFWVLSTRMIPPIVVVIPIFLTAYMLNLYDTILIVVLMHSGLNLCFAVWMLRGTFEGIPKEMDEAAMVDGCTRMGALVRIILPLSLPGIVATAIFVFIMSWNEFIVASVLTSTNSVTAPAFISTAITPYYVLWEKLFASSMLVIIPPIVLSLIIQKYIIKALTFGYA